MRNFYIYLLIELTTNCLFTELARFLRVGVAYIEELAASVKRQPTQTGELKTE